MLTATDLIGKPTRLRVEADILIIECLHHSPEMQWKAEHNLSTKLSVRRTAVQCTVPTKRECAVNQSEPQKDC